ncbi:RMD1 family protein [Aestuariibacter sp. AA17]|uniref:RMD1 family protein n=1 Tax=Fluctibacter corallii TaxID=2984329 RepID=A0ABT3AA16_9ALTE|nr:RMD1 family protein [Aestuariibacter sp. AA17]MCV2885524.1 RMD1 family protein [Aestuariibacter sp. AA17]
MANAKAHDVEFVLIGRNISLEKVSKQLGNQFFEKRYRDALYISVPNGDCFVFDYGVFVCWGLSDQKRDQILEEILPATLIPEESLRWEKLAFDVHEDKPVSISGDEVSLPNRKTLTLLAVSHAIAQSCKLEQFESVAEKVILDNAYLSDTLAKTGNIPLNRKKLAKLRGMLFQTTNDIVLHFNLLDTPEFFWEYPDQEAHYLAVAKYLDLKPRIELLNLKLDTIHSLLEMLAAEQNHKHSAFLEWIIIILIAVDIAVYFGH